MWLTLDAHTFEFSTVGVKNMEDALSYEISVILCHTWQCIFEKYAPFV